MPAIRHRYHYGAIILNSKGLAEPTTALVQGKLPALNKQGDLVYNEYGGFFDADSVMNYVQRVKLVNIDAFTHDEDGMSNWIDIPSDRYLIGVYLHGRYYVLLDEDRKPLIKT